MKTHGMRPVLLDLVCALRALRASPFFTCVAVGTLALGISLNLVVFSFVNSIWLNSLPYPDPDRLVVLRSQIPNRHDTQDLTAPAVSFLQQHATKLEDVAALSPTEAGVNIASMGRARYTTALRVSPGFFRTLGATPILGRTFDEQEDRAGARVAVLSYALWKNTMDKRADVNSVSQINGDGYLVIGVMPESFHSYPEADLWLPLQLSAAQTDPGTNYRVIARIRKGANAQEAAEELRNLSWHAPSSLLSSQQHISSQEHAILVLQGLQRFESQDASQRLTFLSGAVFIVLLIACSNIAMLLLVRAVGRSHEIGIRIAMGSPRIRLVQLFFLEGVVISTLSGLVGLILAKEILPFIFRLSLPGIPSFARVQVDWHVVEFTFGISAFTALLFGIATAVRLARFQMNDLSRTTVRVTAGAAQSRSARLIMVIQTALTLILLSGAMLLLGHLLALEKIRPGFDPRQALVAQVALVGRRYETTAETARVLDRILTELRASNAVEGAATVSALPLERGLNVPIHPEDTPNSIGSAEYRSISPDYFSTMRIPLRQGRLFTSTDGSQANQVAIVNEALARKWWPASPAAGHFITLGKELGPEFTDQSRLIVGVVADVHESSLEQQARPTVFVPAAQVSDSITRYANQHFLTSIIIRTADLSSLSQQVRSAVQAVDPDLSVVSFRPLIDLVRSSTRRDRFYALSTAGVAGLALLITAVGLYGLVSYHINVRAREIAVRISFGANRSHGMILIVGQTMRLVAAGLVAGTAAYFFCLRALAKLFYNLRAFTWAGLGSGIALLALVALLASLVAALRISSIEPLVLLRDE